MFEPSAMKKFFILLLGVLIFISAACAYILLVPAGSAWLTGMVFSRLAPGYDPDPSQTRGTLFHGMSYRNLEIPLHPYPQFSEGYVLRIERFELGLDGLRLRDIVAEAHNVRLVVPLSDPLVLSGELRGGKLDVNIYARAVSLDQIRAFVPDLPRSWQAYEGTLSEVDVYIRGPLDNIEISGRLKIDTVKNNDFTARDIQADVQTELKPAGAQANLGGFIDGTGGTLRGPRTALVHLEKGRLTFDPLHPDDPTLNITAWAKVERTKINIRLDGRLNDPQIVLTSQPPMPQPRLLIMLATDKSWGGTETALFDRKIPVGLAKDFLDYFVFSGTGSRLAQKFGIKDFFINYNKDVQGFGVTKSLTDSVDAIYEMEQRPTATDGKVTREHKVGGSLRIQDNLSITAKQGFKQNSSESQPDGSAPQARGESGIKLKFEQKF